VIGFQDDIYDERGGWGRSHEIVVFCYGFWVILGWVFMGSGSWESGTLRHSRTKVEPSTSRDIFYFSTSGHDCGKRETRRRRKSCWAGTPTTAEIPHKAMADE